MNIRKNAGVFACVVALALLVAGCGGADKSADETSSPDTQQTQSVVQDDAPQQADQTDVQEVPEGSIDVATTGSQVATFRGPKYIVSDATVDQLSGGRVPDELGHQEMCVVNQPEAWEEIDSIAWDRNSISFTQVAMAWGKATYRYEYINEAGASETTEEWSRTTEDKYFADVQNVQHADVGGHALAYVYDDQGDAGVASGEMVDLEAQAMGIPTTSSGRTVSVRCYEQRADKCALIVTVTCAVNDGAPFDLTGEQILQDAYAPLEFLDKGAQTDAASFVSDVAISNAEGDKSIVIARNDDDLVSYTQYVAVLLGDDHSEGTVDMVSYNFAPTEELDGDVEEYQVGDYTVLASVIQNSWEFGEETVTDRLLDASVEIDGSQLQIEATIASDEDVEAALERLLTDRITVA